MRVNSPIFRRSLLAKNSSKSRRLNLNGLQLAALSCGNVASRCWRFLRGPCLVLHVLIDVIPIFIQENRGSERLGYSSQTALNKPSPGCSASHQPDVTALSFGHISFPPCHIPSWHWLRDVVIAWDLVQFPERNSVAELESSYIIKKLLILLSVLFAFFFFKSHWDI